MAAAALALALRRAVLAGVPTRDARSDRAALLMDAHFALGLLIGGWAGFVLFALCVAAGNADQKPEARVQDSKTANRRTMDSWVVAMAPHHTKTAHQSWKETTPTAL